jgi:hypothetical protein
MKQPNADVALRNEGSIWLVTPLTQEASTWLHAHTDGQWFLRSLVVEPRYVADLVQGMRDEGFTVR